jgi:hypothetical protein
LIQEGENYDFPFQPKQLQEDKAAHQEAAESVGLKSGSF